ncbi:hypothetical protein [Qipengyuania algicida]|uniref:hypothetical protein n=1 Tax=Qipengyuania algicida TaxID=1836209 RepID=UPI001F22996B|nr:hypothetical protein [Qipengyuania algicida]
MMRPKFVLTAIIIVACAACSADDASPAVPEAACGIALDYAKAFKSKSSRQIAIWQRPEPRSPLPQKVQLFLRQNPRFKNDPTLPLILESSDIRNVSVVEQCPSLKSWLNETSVLHDDHRINAITLLSQWPVNLLAMSVPVLSKDGSTALMYTSESSGPLAAGHFAITYKKTAKDRWVLLTKEALAIS